MAFSRWIDPRHEEGVLLLSCWVCHHASCCGGVYGPSGVCALCLTKGFDFPRHHLLSILFLVVVVVAGGIGCSGSLGRPRAWLRSSSMKWPRKPVEGCWLGSPVVAGESC